MASGIEQLIELVKNNPELAKKLISSVDMDTVFDLVKSKGVEIAKDELQDFIKNKLNIGDDDTVQVAEKDDKFDLGDVAETVLKSGVAGNILKGIFGKK
jgi:hypothetical protein